MKRGKKTRTTSHRSPQFYVQPTAASAGSLPVVRRLFEVNSEPHTGARPSVRLCVGLIMWPLSQKYPDFGMITISKWKTETTCKCQAEQVATFDLFRRLKGHHEGTEPQNFTPYFLIYPEILKIRGILNRGCEVRYLHDVLLNAWRDQKLQLVQLDTHKWSQFFILRSLSSRNRGIYEITVTS